MRYKPCVLSVELVFEQRLTSDTVRKKSGESSVTIRFALHQVSSSVSRSSMTLVLTGAYGT